MRLPWRPRHKERRGLTTKCSKTTKEECNSHKGSKTQRTTADHWHYFIGMSFYQPERQAIIRRLKIPFSTLRALCALRGDHIFFNPVDPVNPVQNKNEKTDRINRMILEHRSRGSLEAIRATYVLLVQNNRLSIPIFRRGWLQPSSVPIPTSHPIACG